MSVVMGISGARLHYQPKLQPASVVAQDVVLEVEEDIETIDTIDDTIELLAADDTVTIEVDDSAVEIEVSDETIELEADDGEFC